MKTSVIQSWVLVGTLVVLPAVFVFLNAFLSFMGWSAPPSLILLGVWLGYGFALWSILRSLPGGVLDPRLAFAAWAAISLGLVAYALLGEQDGRTSFSRLVSVLLVLYTMGVAAGVYRLRRRGVATVVAAIGVGGASIALLAALAGFVGI